MIVPCQEIMKNFEILFQKTLLALKQAHSFFSWSTTFLQVSKLKRCGDAYYRKCGTSLKVSLVRGSAYYRKYGTSLKVLAQGSTYYKKCDTSLTVLVRGSAYYRKCGTLLKV